MHEHQQTEEEFFLKKLFYPLTTLKAIHWIVIIGFVVFSNGLFNNFIGDDESQIIVNILVHSISNIGIFFNGGTFFNSSTQLPFGVYYKPLLLTFYSLIYTFFGPNYFIYHLIQLLFHILNTIFLFLVLGYFLKKQTAFLLSLIFLLHPINSEAVYYISDLQDILFFFFGILSLWIIQNYHSKKAIIIALICLFFSLLSKETGILFLCITIVYLFLYKKQEKFYVFFWGVIFFAVYLILRIHAIGITTQLTTSSLIANYPLEIRMVNIPAMFLFYLKTFFYPLNLAMSYQWVYTKINFYNFYLPLLIDLIFLLILIFLASYCYKKLARKYFIAYIFFMVWFVIGILFHMQIFPLDATVAERWFYFPIVGLLGISGVLIDGFHLNLKNRWIVSVFIFILFLLSLRTFIRSFDWRNELTLGTHDIKVSDAWGTEDMLSAAYGREMDFTDAKIHAERSIALYPHMFNYMNLGVAETNLGEYKQAKEAFQKSLHLGDYFQTYEGYANLDTVYGNPQENINFIKNVALKKFPQDGILWFCLAIIEYNYGNKNNAKFDIAQAYTYEPTSQVALVYNAINKGVLKRIIVHY